MEVDSQAPTPHQDSAQLSADDSLANLFDEPAVEEAQSPPSDGGDLFGDGDDDEQVKPLVLPEREISPQEEDDGLTPEQRSARRALEYNEEDMQAPSTIKKQETIAQIQLANFGIPPGGKVWHARLPNFLSLSTAPFEELMWEPEDAEESSTPSQQGEGGDSTPGTPKASLPDENYMRWRWAKDAQGQPTKESNARVVRWSDGSLSLQLGSELFDISTALDHSASTSSSSTGATALKPSASVAPSLSSFPASRPHGLTYLTAKHDYVELIEAQASVHGTLTFRPTTLQSKTHQRLAGAIAGRYVKNPAIKLAQVPEQDPEKMKAERERAEVERAKKAKREAMRGAGGGARRKADRRATRFSDGEDDEDADEDGDDGFAAGERRQPKRGAGGPLAQADEEEDEDDEGFVVADEEDDEGEGEDGRVGGKRDRRKETDDQMEMDEMDEAEARIEREERRRKDRKRERQDEPEEPAMAPRRRLVVDDDEDE